MGYYPRKTLAEKTIKMSTMGMMNEQKVNPDLEV